MERISTNGLYQSIFSVSVDYHAGTFFVYKQTRYLKFSGDGYVHFLERSEGQRLSDTDYLKLFLEFENLDSCQSTLVEKVNWNALILSFQLNHEHKKANVLCFPSILIETVQGPITELVLDWRDSNSKKAEVYRFIGVE